MYPEYEQSSKRLARYFGVGAEELLLTNGGDEALARVLRHLRGCGFQRSHLRAYFPMYRYYGEIAGAQVEALRYGPEMEVRCPPFWRR